MRAATCIVKNANFNTLAPIMQKEETNQQHEGENHLLKTKIWVN
jgi:hypothetical protein